jgi:hypothetical protein
LKVLGTTGADLRVPGLHWNIGELTTHVVSAAESVEAYLREEAPTSSGRPPARPPQLPLASAGDDLRSLAMRLRRAVLAFLEDTPRRPAATTIPWLDGKTVDIPTATALLAAELLVHGRDLALARGVSWPIPAPEGRQVILGLLPFASAPLPADRPVHARIRMWGGGRFGIRLEGGELEITGGDGSADATIWAHPATLLLIMFGRMSVTRATVSGRSLAWGRRPSVLAELPRLFPT